MIRIATPSDYPQILDITNEVIKNTTAIYRNEPHTLETRQSYFDEKEAKNIPIFVSEQDHKILGFATYGSFRDNPGYLYTIEHSIHIHAEHRGQGIASELMKKLIEHVSLQGYKTLIGVIDSKNSASRHLHEKLGFKLSGTITNAAIKFDTWLDACFYQLDLPGPQQAKKKKLARAS